MKEPTVNISDFHCRGMKSRPGSFAPRNLNRPYDLYLLEAERAADSTTGAGACTVFDIEEAREAQRARSRYIPRPISLVRRAKVLCFTGAAPARQMARIEAARGPETWNASAEGPNDFPPAA